MEHTVSLNCQPRGCRGITKNKIVFSTLFFVLKPKDLLFNNLDILLHIKNAIHCEEKMATGTFTYNALRTKPLKELIKTQRKIVTQTHQEMCF